LTLKMCIPVVDGARDRDHGVAERWTRRLFLRVA